MVSPANHQKVKFKIHFGGNSLEVQWLELCAYIAEGPGSIPGWGAKIPQAARHSQKKKKSTF